jgi:hypothetical protein
MRTVSHVVVLMVSLAIANTLRAADEPKSNEGKHLPHA